MMTYSQDKPYDPETSTTEEDDAEYYRQVAIEEAKTDAERETEQKEVEASTAKWRAENPDFNEF
jgi:hypothetical protein